MGNIIEIFENGRSACRYEYDSLGRLTRGDNVAFGKTTTSAYDNNGNIIAKYEYAITTKPTSELHLLDCTTFTYCYADNSDQLMSYNGEEFVYDTIGNPTTYRSKTATWEYGRQLTSFDGNTFSYDARGRRTAKNGITFTYDSKGNLIKQSNGLEFLYDHTGVFAFKYDNSTYFYRKNAQQDIIAILDNTGAVVVKYKYDAWGNCKVLNADGTTIIDDTHIGILNPFRYRSYYYDTGIGLYYLNTRYFDPEIGRFMTIDDISYLDPDSINGLNLYSYCENNPVMRVDAIGCAWWNPFTWDWSSIGKIAAGVAVVAGLVVGSVFTGGTLSVILAGAAIGAIAGGIGAGISTAVSGGNIEDFANSFLMSTITGAISGAVAASPLGVGWQMGINAALGMANYAGTQRLSGNKITLGGLAINALIGVTCGYIGQSGWMQGQTTSAFIAFAGQNALKHVFAMVGTESLLRMVIPAIVLGGMGGGIYARISEYFNQNGKFIGI